MVAPKSSTLACTGNAGIPHGGIVRFFAPDISQKAIHAAALRASFSLYFYGRMSAFPPVRKACCTPAFRGFCWQIIASRSHGMCHLNRCNPLNMRVGLSFFFLYGFRWQFECSSSRSVHPTNSGDIHDSVVLLQTSAQTFSILGV